jgi:MipA family protein
MSKKFRFALLAGLMPAVLFSFTSGAFAQSGSWFLPQFDSVPAPEANLPHRWSLSLGAGVFTAPEYEGSDNYDVTFFPSIRASYGENLSFNARQGLRYNFLNEGGFTLGAGVGGHFGRDEDQSSYLTGLGDIDPTAEGKLFADYRLGPAKVSFTFAHDLLDEHGGFKAKAKIGTGFPVPTFGLFVRPSVSTTFASDDYMDSFFGISAAQAVSSGLAAYNPDAGFKDVSANMLVIKKFSERWSSTGTLSYKHLLAEAADSPIVKKEGQIFAGFSISYKY